jgi:hypothetical protein
MNKQTITFLAAVTLASTSFAGTSVVTSKEFKQPVVSSSYFQDQEFTLDLAYSYNDAVKGDSHGYFHDKSGGGAGANFFFARYFGIGVDGNWFGGGPDNVVLHQVTGNLILRYPIDMRGFGLAPYVFAGGGEVFDGKQTSLGDAGGGLEVRLTQRIGIFTDWRYNFTGSHRGDLDTTRVGIRFVF